MPIDLNIFCYKGKDEGCNKYKYPWSEGAFSYASDGSILIRVSRLPDVLENKLVQSVINDQKISGFFNNEIDMWFRVPDITPEKMICEECYNSHYNRYCEECGGNGYVNKKIVVEIEGMFFNNKYLRMILTLPDVKMALINKIGAPAKFRFNGGDGLLMPMLVPKHYDDVKIVKYFEIRPCKTIA